jgi:predicted dehydrogenase
MDLVRTIAGEVRSAQAAASKIGLAPREGDIDDAVTIVLQLESGALATIVVAWTRDDLPGIYSVEVVATEGLYRLDLDPDFKLSGAGRGKHVEFIAAEHPFERSLSRFLDAARQADPKRVFCTPADATRTLAVAVAAEEALVSGRTVTVEKEQ